MKKIKLIKMFGWTDYYGDDYGNITPLSDWAELTQEEYEYLKDWVTTQNTNGYREFNYVIIEDSKKELVEFIKNIPEFIEKERIKAKLAEQERQRIIELNAEKKKARKLEQLEKLKKELESNG
jgi:hypothetical protein